ncbi:MAG: hypothetical protein J6Y94_05930 [Bacteriovoracaceae bacterium]|nr:hypothetical protein [Bacteriovoracaceae bacterium]
MRGWPCPIWGVLCLMLLSACTSWPLGSSRSPSILEQHHYRLWAEQDELDQLAYLGEVYLQSGIDLIPLSAPAQRYLQQIYQQLRQDNEYILPRSLRPNFYVVDTDTPFIFALPSGKFFFGRGLLQKYLHHEELLMAAMAAEMVRLHRQVYRKNIVIPVGHIDTNQMLFLLRLPVEYRAEIDKWASLLLKRSGHDVYAYLNWLQTQNKNTLDFLAQYGDPKGISRQEFLFKKFLIDNGTFKENQNNLGGRMISSSGHYYLLRDMKKTGRPSPLEI